MTLHDALEDYENYLQDSLNDCDTKEGRKEIKTKLKECRKLQEQIPVNNTGEYFTLILELHNACIAALSQLTQDRPEYFDSDVKQLTKAVRNGWKCRKEVKS